MTLNNLNAIAESGKTSEVLPNEWTSGLVRRLIIYIVLTALFTMVMVNYSLRHGRLAVGPTDDDCVYLVDALQRLEILHQSPKQLVQNLIHYAPHSPFSTGLALLGFLIFGAHQWAPYVCNGLVVLVLLLGVDYLTAGAGSEARIAAILFTLAFAFTANIVTEFRPDCAVGIVTGFGLVLLMSSSPLTASRNRALFVGFLAALALLIKPTFGPFTAFTFAVTWLISAFFIHLRDARGGLEPKRLFGRLGWYALPSLILSLPYYLIHSQVVYYIYNQALGRNKHSFELREPAGDILRYYWSGAGGQMMLGRGRYVVILLGLAAVFLLRDRAGKNWRFIAGYLVMVGITYAIPTVTRMSNPFFGTNCDVLILLGAVLILATLLTEARQTVGAGRILRVTAWGAVALGLLMFQWPPAHYNKGSEKVQTTNRLGQQLYQTIRDYPGSHNARVFFTAPGPVDDMLLRFRALCDSLNFWCPNQHVSSNLETFRQEIDAADFVVASEPGSGLIYENMIAPNLQAETLQMARENPHLTELARFPALNGKFFHIFVRRDLPTTAAAEKVVPFEEPWSPLYRRK